MPQPIICLDEEARHFAERFRSLFSKPQYQYFVTVLLGLMECEGRHTLVGIGAIVLTGFLGARYMTLKRGEASPDAESQALC
jgi:hypothetical protein